MNVLKGRCSVERLTCNAYYKKSHFRQIIVHTHTHIYIYIYIYSENTFMLVFETLLTIFLFVFKYIAFGNICICLGENYLYLYLNTFKCIWPYAWTRHKPNKESASK